MFPTKFPIKLVIFVLSCKQTDRRTDRQEEVLVAITLAQVKEYQKSVIEDDSESTKVETYYICVESVHPHMSILNVQLLPVISYIICFIISHSIATPEWSSHWLLHITKLILLGIYSSWHWSLSFFSLAPVLVFTVSHHLCRPADFSHLPDRDGGVYPGYSKSHRSTGPQSTPKPAESWRKITGHALKKPTISYFLASALSLPYQSHQHYRSLLHFLVCSFFFRIALFIFHFTLFHSDNAFHYIRCVCPQRLLLLFSEALPIPIPGSNFSIPFIF